MLAVCKLLFMLLYLIYGLEVDFSVMVLSSVAWPFMQGPPFTVPVEVSCTHSQCGIHSRLHLILTNRSIAYQTISWFVHPFHEEKL